MYNDRRVSNRVSISELQIIIDINNCRQMLYSELDYCDRITQRNCADVLHIAVTVHVVALWLMVM